MASKSDVRNVVIIGSGPAGYTAAIYTARAKLAPLQFEGEVTGPGADLPGGQLMLTTEVENFPGFEKGIMGPDLMEVMKKQALRFGAEIKSLMVTRVDFSKQPFEVETREGVTKTRAVIIATGAKAKLLGLPEERTVDMGGLMGRGVSTCATCDGAFFKDNDLIVVGGGDSAMEEANFLTRFAKTVTIVHRRESFRASKIMLERARTNEKIKFVTDSTITKIHGKEEVSGVTLKNLKTGATTEVKAEGVFVAIGHTPNTALFKGQIDLDENGYIVVKKGAATNVPGVFAAGDVADHVYRQAITAAGTGCQAAIDAERWLAEHEHVEAPIHAGAWGTPAAK